jgi:hypothetical protein
MRRVDVHVHVRNVKVELRVGAYIFLLDVTEENARSDIRFVTYWYSRSSGKIPCYSYGLQLLYVNKSKSRTADRA